MCPCCGRRCHVPVSRQMPNVVREAYAKAGWGFMSTCDEGVLREHKLLGASYADVIVQRLGSVQGAHLPKDAGELRDELAQRVEAMRKRMIKGISKNEQLRAQSRDLRDQARALRGAPPRPAPEE